MPVMTVILLQWDHRNGSMLQKWLVDEYILGPDGVGNDNITGVFIDGAHMKIELYHFRLFETLVLQRFSFLGTPLLGHVALM